MIVRARFVIAADGPVIENGRVECHRGVIADVRRARAGERGGGGDGFDFGDAVVLPGLVNAHTHLELSHLAGKVPATGGLIAWLERLVALAVAAPPDADAVAASVRRGLAESTRAGVTCVGDITRHPSVTRPILGEAGVAGVSYGEVAAVGRTRSRLGERLVAALHAGPAGLTVRPGVSPHSIYTLEPAGLRACAGRARAANVPVCTHLAESPDEDEFARSAGGPLRDYLERLGVWDEHIRPYGCGAIEAALGSGLSGGDVLFAHLNYAGDADLDAVARSGAHVAYCPRTHAAFGHPPHRFRDMLTRGINVCVGTDSLASNPSLSVLEEIRFLGRRQAGLAPAALLEMATLSGARALGVEAACGSLAAGKRADLVVIPLSAGATDPLEEVVSGDALPAAVFLGGKQVVPETGGAQPVA